MCFFPPLRQDLLKSELAWNFLCTETGLDQGPRDLASISQNAVLTGVPRCCTQRLQNLKEIMLKKNKDGDSFLPNRVSVRRQNYFITFMHLCVCMCAYAIAHMWQRTACGSQFSFSTMWVPGIKLQLSGLAAGTFTY